MVNTCSSQIVNFLTSVVLDAVQRLGAKSSALQSGPQTY